MGFLAILKRTWQVLKGQRDNVTAPTFEKGSATDENDALDDAYPEASEADDDGGGSTGSDEDCFFDCERYVGTLGAADLLLDTAPMRERLHVGWREEHIGKRTNIFPIPWNTREERARDLYADLWPNKVALDAPGQSAISPNRSNLQDATSQLRSGDELPAAPITLQLKRSSQKTTGPVPLDAEALLRAKRRKITQTADETLSTQPSFLQQDPSSNGLPSSASDSVKLDMASELPSRLPLALLTLPQELQDMIFDLAFPGNDNIILPTNSEFEEQERDRHRHDPKGYTIRTFTSCATVNAFMVSKAYFIAAARAFVQNSTFDASTSTWQHGILKQFLKSLNLHSYQLGNAYPQLPHSLRAVSLDVHPDAFQCLEPGKYAWHDELDDRDIEEVLQESGIHRLRGLREITLRPRRCPYAQDDAQEATWERNVARLSDAVRISATSSSDSCVQSRPQLNERIPLYDGSKVYKDQPDAARSPPDTAETSSDITFRASKTASYKPNEARKGSSASLLPGPGIVDFLLDSSALIETARGCTELESGSGARRARTAACHQEDEGLCGVVTN